jgi:hypothetical protein
MTLKRAEYADALRALPPEAIAGYLMTHSGLPGPRSNLTLLDAAGDVLSRDLALAFLTEDDEYLASCGTVTLGRLLLEGDNSLVRTLTRLAADGRWRVRESVAIAAQRVGDQDAVLLRELVTTWTAHADPLVVRAGIAAVCEPRLLADPRTAAAAIAACQEATAHLAATPSERRRDAGVRTLRQGLAYCWSVAVAGDPVHGLPAFAALDTADPDIAWVVTENRKKKRLAALL